MSQSETGSGFEDNNWDFANYAQPISGGFAAGFTNDNGQYTPAAHTTARGGHGRGRGFQGRGPAGRALHGVAASSSHVGLHVDEGNKLLGPNSSPRRGGRGRGFSPSAGGGANHVDNSNPIDHYSPNQSEAPTAAPFSGRGGSASRGAGRGRGSGLSIGNDGPVRGGGRGRGSSHRGGSQSQPRESGRSRLARLTKPFTATFPFSTVVPENQKEEILAAMKQLVIPNEILRTFGGYRHVYGKTSAGTLLGADGSYPLVAVASNVYCLPPVNPARPKRAAIAIDGEFLLRWTNKALGQSDKFMGNIGVVDVMTNEVLIKGYCMPTMREGGIKKLDGEYSGIYRKDVDAARERGDVVFEGLPDLYAALARYADQSTLILGHAFGNDALAMRLSLPNHLIVDTQAVFRGLGGNDTPSFKNCMASLAGAAMQEGKHHDPVEDACATRELALIQCARQIAGAPAP